MNYLSGEQLYQPKSPDTARDSFDVLSRPPEILLSGSEKSEVVEFEKLLLAFRVGNDTDASVFGERSLTKLPLMAAPFYEITPEVLLTPKGREVAYKAGADYPSNIQEAQSYILQHSRELPLPKLEKESDRLLEARYVAALTAEEAIPDPTLVITVGNIDKVVEKYGLLRKARDYLKEARIAVQEVETTEQVKQATSLLVDMYQEKINATIATMTPNLVTVLDRLDPEERDRCYVALGEQDSARLRRIAAFRASHTSAEVAERLDALRNGRSRDSAGYTPFALVGAEGGTEEREQANAARFSPEEVKQLRTMRMNTVQAVSLIETVLAEWGMLSTVPSDKLKEAKSRPADKKWWVRVRSSGAFSLTPTKNCVNVPQDLDRAAVNDVAPYGVIATVAHELYHVRQNHAQEPEGGLKLGHTITGKNYKQVTEAGAVREETTALNYLFGIQRKCSQAYISAVEALMENAPLYEIARRFAQTLAKEAGLDKPDSDQIRTAADRCWRLRRAGGFSTAVLSYVEEGQLSKVAAEFDDEVTEKVFLSGNSALSRIADMHRFGLFEPVNTANNLRAFEDIAEEWIRQNLLNKD